MKEIVRVLAVLSFYFAAVLALSAWSGCATVKAQAPRLLRVAKCVALAVPACFAAEYGQAHDGSAPHDYDGGGPPMQPDGNQ